MMEFARQSAFGGALLGVALLGVGLLAGSGGVATFGAAESGVAPAVERSTVASSERGARSEEVSAPRTSVLESTVEGSRVRAADPLVDLDVVPHPASERATSDARQHELFAALDLALEQLDFERARALLGEHARAFPDGGWLGQRRGFELVLDCLEHADERQRYAGEAERYLQEERISPLRRSVRRVCIEGRGFRRRA